MSQSRRLRLLLVSPTLSGGGAERFASTLLTGLPPDDFEIRLALMTPLVSYPLPPEVEVRDLGKRRPRDLPRAIVRLRQEIRSWRPDVVMGNMLYTNWVIGAAMLRLRGLRPRWLARFATLPLREYSARGLYGRNGAMARPFVRRLLLRADHWVANSQGLSSDVAEFLGVEEFAVETIPNPVDFGRLDTLADATGEPLPSTRGPVLLWVGRLSNVKRPDLLVEAFSRVRRSNTSTLWIVGDGPLRDQVQHDVRSRGLDDDVALFGFQENPFRYMKKSDLFILTSDFEGLPNALIEAQGMGLSAVSTRCRYGPEEIVEDNVTGTLVPTGDASALTRAIEDLLKDADRRQRMGDAAKIRSRGLFDSRKVIAKWSDLIAGRGDDQCAG